MGNYFGAGVRFRELDLSSLVPNLSTTIGAIVGSSNKGTLERKLITSGRAFVEEYGNPVAGNYFHYSALAFLAQGNQLYCKRVVASTGNLAYYGGVSIQKTGGEGSNKDLDAGSTATDWDTLDGTGTYTDNLFFIIGKDPGTWNNSISVKVTNNAQDATWFDIVVYYTEKGITRLVETWTVSRYAQLDGDGNQMYLETKINGYSKYILVVDNTNEVNTVMPDPQATALAMASGANGDAPSETNVSTGWDDFDDPNDIDVRILINNGYTAGTVQAKMKAIAEARKDCMAVLDIPYASCTDAATMVTWRSSTQNYDSNYCALYGPWVKDYDTYNGGIKNLPPSGYVAAMYAYNDYVGNVWTSPAGSNRGTLNVAGTTLAISEGDIETLQAVQINPIVNFRGQGVKIWGDLTEQKKTSALSLISVRRLLIVLEKTISTVLRDFVFEPNTPELRLRVSSLIEEYLAIISAQGGFQTEGGDRGYKVVCNEVNNTPATIDRQELLVDVFVKPVKPAKYIELTAIITTTGSNFEELIASGSLI
jgi:phage tail sheath protein FI